MLTELHVRNLGVIADLTLVLGPGMTAITGETGAGKTLVVEAVELLVGGRADSVLVRPGADEASVEGRFVLDGDREVVVARAVPRAGRSRAYFDGRIATVGELADFGRTVVDLHGQHAHQSLLSAQAQRAALDRFGAVDLQPLAATRARVDGIKDALDALGGDSRARAREIDLLRFQLTELRAAGIEDPGEEERLEQEEDRLASATADRTAGAAAHDALAGDGGAVDKLARAIAECAGRKPFAEIEPRLRSIQAELSEAATDLRLASEEMVNDDERLDAIRARRRVLFDLRRKYGERLVDVMAYQTQIAGQLAELESHEQRVAVLEQQRAGAEAAVAAAAAQVAQARRQAAPRLGVAIQERLHSLAMPNAVVEVVVDGPDPGDDVRFLLAANPGEGCLPLAKVASGGELSRAMLAAHLVLTEAPAVLVFDEVDAGIGGEVAVAVGRALATLAARHQVLVVTHLPQVAAFAGAQVAVAKRTESGRTVADARVLDDDERLVELSRMLSGQPESARARDHAKELLTVAGQSRHHPQAT